MPFTAKTVNWRKLPVEIREDFLRSLRHHATGAGNEALSPVELAKRCGLTPDKWQQEVLESTARQVILLCSRQSGKSTISALLALHTALYTPNSLTLVVAPAMRQSAETFRKTRDFLTHLKVDEPAAESALRLEFHNKSRIIVIPGNEKTTRGYSGVNLLICDEAAQLNDDSYMALRPVMATSQGRIVLLSTPAGMRGFFHSEWTTGGNDWLRVRVPASECPRINKDWLQAERERVGNWWASQEYDVEFMDASTQIFATEDIMNMLSDEVEPLWPTP